MQEGDKVTKEGDDDDDDDDDDGTKIEIKMTRLREGVQKKSIFFRKKS